MATSTVTPGWRARNPGIKAGSTKRAVGTGTLSRRVPTGRWAPSSRSLNAASISASAGRRRSSRRVPVSVGVTLRVVRWSRRTSRSRSRRRMRSLSDDGDTPRRSAAARNPPASTTAANSTTSLRSGWRMHRPSEDCTDYRTRHSLLSGLSTVFKPPACLLRDGPLPGAALPPGGRTMTQQTQSIRTVGDRLYRRGLFALGIGLGGLLQASSAIAQTAPKPDWNLADMPSQAGRIFLVTGGTSGMGFEDARALGAAGARVVIAARNPRRGEEAIARIRREHPDAQVQFEPLDLADLSSVRALGERLAAALPRLDGLINNAAIMAPPERGVSADGFESQLATNYIGHFALTAQVLPLLRRSESPRVVTLASIAVARGAIDFDDLQSTRRYDPYRAYAQSKLA